MNLKKSEPEYPRCGFCGENSVYETETKCYSTLRLCTEHARELFETLKKEFEKESENEK